MKTMILTMMGLGQRNGKCDTKDCFIFDSWFASNISDESVMDIGAGMIGMVETNT